MNRVRYVLLVLFATDAVTASEPGKVQRPSLFAPAPSAAIAIVAMPPPSTLPTSPHIRARIKSLVEAIPAPSPPPFLARAPTTDTGTEAIAMAPFVVTERPVQLKLSAPKNTFLNAVRSGHLWRFGDSNAEVVSLGQRGAGGHGRITVGISIDF